MKIKTSSIALILVLSLTFAASAADTFAVKTALNQTAARKSCEISVVSGQTLAFSTEDLELRLGLGAGTLAGITVTALPSDAEGELVLDGVAIDTYDYISREEVDRLCFVPADGAVAASIQFIPRAEDSVAANLEISVLNTPNQPPQIEDASITTSRNVAITGYIAARDPEGAPLRIQVVKPPVNGVVRFDGLSYTYMPYKNVAGKDSFAVCAVDEQNSYSRQATVSIAIERPRSSFSYADMQTHPSAYAAIKLHEYKVMTGAQVGGKYFFYPDEQMNRGEFLVALIVSSGFEKSMKPAVNTGLPNDAAIPYWLKPYVKKAAEEGILSKKQAFFHDQIPTRAEAVVMTARASKINDVRDFALTMFDAASIPDWAVQSYKELAAYRMLDLNGNMAQPSGALTNSYCADLIWQLFKHYNR